MTPINEVFMLSIDSKLDYELLKKICMTGHSRVPVYEEVEVPEPLVGVGSVGKAKGEKAKKIVGILLVKQCVLLDPKGPFHFPFYITMNTSPTNKRTQTQSPSANSPSIRSPSYPKTCPFSESSINSKRAARTWPLYPGSVWRKLRA